ncbi:hypothetical protein [Spongiactinospora sp. 9N601]|uniref:hypothetical protein n=1 Tax=Spongiactinospora sp. 9N601 TaxID=3375149 RepID=UPI0037B7EEEA
MLACAAGHDGVIGGRVPFYAFPEQAVDALARAAAYAEWRARPAEPDDVDRGTARAIVQEECRPMSPPGYSAATGSH